MRCCGYASNWAKLGLLCTVGAFVSHVVGYLTNNWMRYDTLTDYVDLRIGLFWFTNCTGDIPCFSQPTPSIYKSVSFTITQIVEGGVAGLLLIMTVMFCFYVLHDKKRTRRLAVAIIIHFGITVCCSVGGLILWIIQINHPYFFAWSAGLSVVAIVLSLIAIFCLMLDIRKYPYKQFEKMQAEQTIFEKHGAGPKKGKGLGRDFDRKEPYSNGNRFIGNEYGRRYPLSNEYNESDRFFVNVVTPMMPTNTKKVSNSLTGF